MQFNGFDYNCKLYLYEKPIIDAKYVKLPQKTYYGKAWTGIQMLPNHKRVLTFFFSI